MNLLETMNVGTEVCKTMKRSESEEQQKIQSLQDTISKCKTLLKEQAQVISQKDLKISRLEKLLREKDVAYARLLQQKAEQKERLERKIESERSNYRYLNSRLRETEEELDRERGKSAWDKFREKHHLRLPKKRYKIPNYNKTRRREMIVRKLLFGVYCVIWGIIGIALFIWVMGM